MQWIRRAQRSEKRDSAQQASKENTQADEDKVGRQRTGVGIAYLLRRLIHILLNADQLHYIAGAQHSASKRIERNVVADYLLYVYSLHPWLLHKPMD